MLDLGERQFFAQLVALATVAGEIDRLRVEKRFVEPVELLLDYLDPAFLFRRALASARRCSQTWRIRSFTRPM